ncbi:exosortase C-terminal domain/associated protein EpsI [uncultured Methylophaga sp.]|uniref:exosortase C-terminal domain/associated protein EpsI n=1 Tax=uncultured Methylophaga sp. TaxID=285271 RepID=UPI002629E0A6|nr:exosortase C-terminal domain/associated protein EpsI [uncultured Methylophaga sp.]
MTWLKVCSVSALMVLTATLAVWATPTDYLANIKHREPLMTHIKPVLGSWQLAKTSDVLVTSAVLDEKLDSAYTDRLSETYFNADNQKVMLSVAYSENQRSGLAVHLPEACYPAQGFEVLEKRSLPLMLADGRQLQVKYMKTQRANRVEPLLYWTVAGERLYRNNIERKQVTVEYGLNNIIPDGLVFRVSTIEADEETALNNMTDFVRDFYRHLAVSEKPRFFGAELTQSH